MKASDKKLVTYLGIVVIILNFCSCWSSTGDIDYEVSSALPADKRLGLASTIAILDIRDQRSSVKNLRSKRKGNLIGVFYGGYKNPMRKIYSNQPIKSDVSDALERVLKEHGINVARYAGYSDISNKIKERIAVKGLINEFFLRSYPGLRSASPTLEATIDIDLVIFDMKYQREVWSGKITSVKKMPKHKGIFTKTDQIFSFLSMVLSDGLNKALIRQGMLKAIINSPERKGGFFQSQPLKFLFSRKFWQADEH